MARELLSFSSGTVQLRYRKDRVSTEPCTRHVLVAGGPQNFAGHVSETDRRSMWLEYSVPARVFETATYADPTDGQPSLRLKI